MTKVFETEDMGQFLAVKKALKEKTVIIRDHKRVGMLMLIEVANRDQERATSIIKRVLKNRV